MSSLRKIYKRKEEKRRSNWNWKCFIMKIKF